MPGADSECEQLALFELGGPDVARLKAVAEKLVGASTSAATKRAYASDWRDFEEWCSSAGRPSLPASSETIELFAVDRLRVMKLATVERRLHAIAAKHVETGHASTYTNGVRSLMRGARRERGNDEQPRAALAIEDLRRICRSLPVRSSETAARDRAIMTLGFAAALRRSEIVALDLADVRFVRKGLLVTLRRSKTDQEAAGRTIGVFYGKRATTCPVRSLRAWLNWRGRKSGPLFTGRAKGGRLSSAAVWLIVKRLVASIGIDPDDYGAHSLRAGFVTTAAEAGVSEALIMKQTGHRSIQTVARYVRPSSAFGVDALAKAL
jgi:site-specific recombinase XerD